MQKQADFIARQLNDHLDSIRGVVQGTYHTWAEPHVLEALSVAIGYLFSIKPDTFAKLRSVKLAEASCYLELSCSKVIDVLGIGDCHNVILDENKGGTNFLTMLPTVCTSGTASSWSLTRLNDHLFVSSIKIPADTMITFLCAQKPKLEDVDQRIWDEYDSLLCAFALWWLLLTDNESRSNIERANLYYQMVKDYVEIKLLLEFSLNEDDYKFGRRRVND